MAGVGKFAIGVTAAAAAATLLAGKLHDVAEVASNQEEARDRTFRTFGSHSGEVMAAADERARKYGVSKRETLEMASSAGMLLQGSGIDPKLSATMGSELARLAAESSSLHNVSVDEAMTRIQSALAGTPRAIREFGVAITEARVEAKALSMGLVDSSGYVTDSAKVSARYALIVEGLSRANGDLDRSQGRFAGQIRASSGNFENLGAALGETLLPTFTAFAQALNLVVQKLTGFVETLNGLRTMLYSGAWDGVRSFFGADLEQERLDQTREQAEIDKANEDLARSALEEDVIAKAQRRGKSGANHTDLIGLYKSIQDAVAGTGRNALLQNQVELQKKTLEEQKKLNAGVAKLVAAQQVHANKRF